MPSPRVRIKSASRATITMCLSATLAWACTGDPDRQPQQPDEQAFADATTDAGGADAAPDLGTPEEDTGPGDDGGVSDTGGGEDADASVEEPDTVDEPDLEVTELRVDTLVPPRGPVDGGTPFVIDGVGFTDATVVYFGGAPAQVALIEGTLVGATPAGVAPGSVDVKLLDPEYGDDTLTGGFSYSASLGLTSVTPRNIPVQGGVELTIQGAGFDAQTRLSLGGQTALRHELLSPTLMRVLAPAGQVGDADARVTNASATMTLPDAVTYYAPLEITSLSPAVGVAAGGDAVVVRGSGFEQDAAVEFDNVPATVTSVSPAGDEIEVTTPAGSAGLADVRVVLVGGEAIGVVDVVVNAGADSSTLAGGFEYVSEIGRAHV